MLDLAALRNLRKADVPAHGNRVAKAIELSGQTQREIASSLGMSEPHLSDIARGRFGTIRMDTAHKLAAHFGCSVDDLFPVPTELRA